MRVFIPTKGRHKSISTHQAFDGSDYFIVVHDEDERERYVDNSTVEESRVIVSGVAADDYGLTRQREWICENLVEPDEWFVFADDNIKALTAVAKGYYDCTELPVQDGNGPIWKDVYSRLCTVERFMEIAAETRGIAESVGAHWCGFATTPNFYFRGTKWRYAGYVIGKLTIAHNIGVPFDHTISMEDFNNTAEHLYRFGAVVINNFVWPQAGHYEGGGMGRYEERVPVRKQDVQLLLRKWPGLFRVKNRPGFEPDTDLALRLHRAKQIQQWRRDLPKLRIQAMGLGKPSWKV